MRDPQNSVTSNEHPSPTQNDEPSREKNQPSQNSYYYDDATGYEIYREGSENEEEDEECADEKSRPNQVAQPGVPAVLISRSEMHVFGAVLHTERSLLNLPDSDYGPLN